MPAAKIRTGLIDPRGHTASAGAAPTSAELRRGNPARAVGPGRTAGDPRGKRTLNAYIEPDPVMNRPDPNDEPIDRTRPPRHDQG